MSSHDDPLCRRCGNLLRWFRDYLDVKDPATITPDTTFVELGVDSLDYMDWRLEAEQHFGIEIPDRDGEQMRTVRDYLVYLREHGADWPDEKRIYLLRQGNWYPSYRWKVVENATEIESDLSSDEAEPSRAPKT